MIFTSPEFTLFAIVFFALYALFAPRARRALLLVASYAFYGSWDVRFLSLLFASTVVDFVAAQRIHASDDARARRAWLALSLVVNLGALGVFKYAGFFVGSASAGLAALGLEVPAYALDIVLPVGISFYTFQTLSYTVDVYRRALVPTTSLLDFALYVAFFPQLVAGPIERATSLLPQLASLSSKKWTPDPSGLLLIAIGVFKKAVIADQLAALPELVYANPGDAYPLAVWVATYAFAIQIYCDFSGYSDIAIGLGRLLGVELMKNFVAPYAAHGPSDFWRRWHVSLSTWLRDYLYISLGGNRGGAWATRRNLLLTMLLGGLWHGAAWNYVLWGAYHGLLLVGLRGRWVDAILARIDALPRAGRLVVEALRRVAFFHLVCVGWAFFRATSLADCVAVTRKLFFVDGVQLDAFLVGVRASGESKRLLAMGAVFVGMLVLQNLFPVSTKRVVDVLGRLPIPIRVALVMGLLYAAAILSPEAPPPFIYFQF